MPFTGAILVSSWSQSSQRWRLGGVVTSCFYPLHQQKQIHSFETVNDQQTASVVFTTARKENTMSSVRS